ncbi:hypothetical protein [Enterobacter hormaechei]|uniref:hypothetical protein n=1 Tax=Enterobacter hormaechei TaxID=158836 RepID=UPI000A891C8C|nr:hypothetical protein [Enterobacter hormaechei]
MSRQKRAKNICSGDEVTLYQWGRYMTATVDCISSVGLWVNVVYVLPGGYRTSRKYDIEEWVRMADGQPSTKP